MIAKKFIPIIIVVLICSISSASFSFEVNPSDEKAHKAIALGSKHFMDVFAKEPVKFAIFGDWPKGDGGIFESKLIYLSIISSMRVRSRMPDVSDEKIQKVLNTTEMPVRISSSLKVFKVIIKQNGKTIEASRIEDAMTMPPMGGAGGGGHPQSLKAYFNYADLDPNGKATIVLYEDFGEIEFPVDFSKFD